MRLDKIDAARGVLPAGVLRVEYRSAADGRGDWALAWPGEGRDWAVVIHGHGSGGDQLYTRPDIRDGWLPAFRDHGLGILTPNLRGNAWMSPLAAADLRALLERVRREFGARRFLFAGGSMGGTSNVIYGCLYPEDVAGVVALGLASDLASFHAWCRARNSGVVKELADAIESAYGGPPDRVPEAYEAHSAVAHADRLAMPMYLAHGADDTLIPVAQPRRLVERLAGAENVTYVEIPGGGHDAPLSLMAAGLDWVLKAF